MRALVRTLLLGFTGMTAIATAGDQSAPPPPPLSTPPATSAPSAPAGDIEDFVPSEKVGAEDAVAFPVDI